MTLDHLSGVWPVLTRYDAEHLARVALPLGGIGTGTVSLGGRGDLRDWEVVNRPAKGFVPVTPGASRSGPFFALWARVGDADPVVRALEGPISPPYEAAFGVQQPNHGLPRFRGCAFAAAYPLGQVVLEDPAVPLKVRLEAYSPMIPADPERSSIPVAVLRYVLINDGREAVSASVCGSVPNFIGTDGCEGMAARNRNTFRREGGISGLHLTSEGVDASDERWGSLTLATAAPGRSTYRRQWTDVDWGDALLEFWDDFSSDGRLEDPAGEPGDAPMASLAVEVTVPPRSERAVPFLLTWHFPNRQSWTPHSDAVRRVGNHYGTQYTDAWDVAVRTAAELPALEEDTLRFVSAFCDSDLPAVVKEAALFNLSALRTQTCFRTEDGRFFGFEGCGDGDGCCHGTCTHVWNYEAASSLLYGALAQTMREVEFGHATDQRGLMSFRVNLPLDRAQEFGRAAADGQMGTIMRLYRDWQWSGDDDLLRRLWPHARRALEFCWVEGGWDADRDGVMEGCQHNTLDVEYYGPNPLMAGWYLGAMRAAEHMALHVGDNAFAATCRGLFARGRAWVDARLFNGEYYEQEIRPPRPGRPVADGLRLSGEACEEPPHQVGSGCLVDQLAGQYMAHVCGLGYLLEPEHVRAALGAVLQHNFREDLFGHFNPLRSFAINDEQGLIMCSFPRGGRPRRPTPYFNELMTGFEYTAAVHMLFEGRVEEGLRCIAAVRARFDGSRRNPFDEAECGHHYARAMAAWSAVVALTGFQWSAVDGVLTFADIEGTHFWSTGYAWGTCTQTGGEHTVRVMYGRLPVRRLVIRNRGAAALDPMTAGDERTVRV